MEVCRSPRAHGIVFPLLFFAMRVCRQTGWCRICVMVGGLCAAIAFGAEARADVEIRTTDGRVLTGVVDSRTTDEVLWVRQESNSIVLATPVPWTGIASASVDGEPIEVTQLAERSGQWTSEARLGFLSEYGPEPLPPHPPSREQPAGRITNLEIDALLVNVNRDVAANGFELMIATVDEFGNNVAVNGDLYVRLMVERDDHHTGRIRFEDIQQWSLPVSPHDFVDGLAAYILPFRQLAPELDDELCTSAQLNARLGVVGEGNFTATVPVVLREFNPYRDRLQMFEGSRFFRDELSTRVHHLNEVPPGIYRKYWSQ